MTWNRFPRPRRKFAQPHAPSRLPASEDPDPCAATSSHATFSIAELEIGLRLMGRADVGRNAFWDENIVGFRQTVLLAIRDTSHALLAPTVNPQWRVQLESQLEVLVQYIELADRYVAERSRTMLRPTLS
jgi:hypothetical protein